MKPVLFQLFIAAAICTFSCKKQVNWTIDPITGQITGDSVAIKMPPLGLLTTRITATNAGTSQTDFVYDTLGKLILETVSGIESSVTKYYYDTAGQILKIASITASNIDSNFTFINYDDYYTKTVLYVNAEHYEQGAFVKDSIVFTHNGNGDIALQKTFRKTGSNYKLKERKEFAYNEGNLISKKLFADSSNTGVMVLINSYKYTYDKGANPLRLRLEALLTGKAEVASANNLVTVELENQTVPAKNYSVSSKLIYGGSLKPLFCTSTKLPGGEVTQVTYLYK